MLAGSGAPPPEENQLKENITSYSKPQSRGPAYWPLISAKSLILETKYRAPANRTGDAGAITDDLAVVEPVSPVIERTPVQASLF